MLERKRLMNAEHPDEAEAKHIVERIMAIQLEHFDTHGGVDYISTDGTIAVEVTTVTDGAIKAARSALSKAKAKDSPRTLQGCWWVFASDTAKAMKVFRSRVRAAIAELEVAGRTSFDRRSAARDLKEDADLSHVFLPLMEAGVEKAVRFPCVKLEGAPQHIHRIRDSTGHGGGATLGSSESIDQLLKELNTKTDNPTKLLASGATQRHLFVWVDDDTDYGIVRPLTHESSSGATEEWGLPTLRPDLDPAIAYLWVVHATSRLGWLWDGKEWRWLRNP